MSAINNIILDEMRYYARLPIISNSQIKFIKMTTKCIDLEKVPSFKKPIEFIYYINSNKESKEIIKSESVSPYQWNNIELIQRGGEYLFDIMFAYDDNRRKDGVVYFGYWNDGIVT